MAVYRIKEILSPMDIKYSRVDYLTHVKQRMIRDLAEKMFEVFGEMQPKTDMITNDQYFEFTLNSWEDYEVEKEKRKSFDDGFARASYEERAKWADIVANLEQKLRDKDKS